MNKYNSYKDSGVEWIGEIPKHWKISKLSYHLDFHTGFTPPTGRDEFYLNGSNNWVTISDLGQKIIRRTKTKLTDLAVQGKTKVPKGSLLYSFKLSVGKMAFAGQDIFTNEAIFSIFPNPSINLNYYYYLLGAILEFNANENIYGAKILNQELIRNSKILAPPADEQFAIGKYLDEKTTEIDDLISKKERLITLLEEEKISFINQAVTKGLDPNVQLKDSGVEWLGEIPKQWQVKKIMALSESITGYAFKSADFSFDDGVKLVRGDNVTEGSLRWGDKTRRWNKLTSELNNFYLESNDIVIGMDGSKVGKNFAFITEKDLPLLLVQRVARVRAQSELYARFILHSISSYNFKYYINSSKTDPAIPHITLKNIRDFKIVIPPTIAELEKLVITLENKIKELEKTITTVKREVFLLKEYKSALISEVVTGKIDVRNEVLVN